MDPSLEVIHIRLIQETMPITYKWLSLKLSITTTQAKSLLESFLRDHSNASFVSLHFVSLCDPLSGHQQLKLMYQEELQDIDSSIISGSHVYGLLPSRLPDLRILHTLDQELLKQQPQTTLLNQPSPELYMATKKVSPKRSPPKSPPPPAVSVPLRPLNSHENEKKSPPKTKIPTGKKSPAKKNFRERSKSPVEINHQSPPTSPLPLQCKDKQNVVKMSLDDVHDPLSTLFDQPLLPEPDPEPHKRRRVRRTRQVTRPHTYVDERGRMMTEDITVEETFSVSEDDAEDTMTVARKRVKREPPKPSKPDPPTGGQQSSLFAFFSKKS